MTERSSVTQRSIGSERRKCWIFFPDGYLGVAPTIKNLADVLAETGMGVEIIGWSTRYPSAGSLHPRITVRMYRPPWAVPGLNLILRVLRKAGFLSLIGLIEISWFLLRNMPAVLAARRSEPRTAVIGVDTVGSVAARVTSGAARRPFGYISLELPSTDRRGPAAAILSWAERSALRRASFVAIQDSDRLTSLTSYLGFRHPNAVLLPNAPRGSTGRHSGGNFLRQELNIPGTEFPTIVLQAGMIEDATHSRDLARAFSGVRPGIALVLHERRERDRNDPYIRALHNLNRRNLFLSLRPVPMDQLDAVYASASVGVAYYRSGDANFTQIARASGKLGYYLKHGLPIIVNKIPSLEEFVTTNRIGVVVSDPADAEELDRAIDQVLADYDDLSRNARRTFSEQLDFDRMAQPLIDTILSST